LTGWFHDSVGADCCDAGGGKADFHALRRKFITELVKAGVQPKDAKELARHSTIVLTMDRYAHVTLKDTAAALAKLAGPTVTSGRGVAPGVAEKGNEQVQSGAMEEADPPDLSPSGETVVTLNPLPSQGVESERGHPVAIQKAEREGFEVRFAASRVPAGGRSTKWHNQSDLWLVEVAR